MAREPPGPVASCGEGEKATQWPRSRTSSACSAQAGSRGSEWRHPRSGNGLGHEVAHEQARGAEGSVGAGQEALTS